MSWTLGHCTLLRCIKLRSLSIEMGQRYNYHICSYLYPSQCPEEVKLGVQSMYVSVIHWSIYVSISPECMSLLLLWDITEWYHIVKRIIYLCVTNLWWRLARRSLVLSVPFWRPHLQYRHRFGPTARRREASRGRPTEGDRGTEWVCRYLPTEFEEFSHYCLLERS